GHELFRSINVIAAGMQSKAVFTFHHVAPVLLAGGRMVFVERCPRTEIVPAKIGVQAEQIGRMLAFSRPWFKDGVVNADVFALGIKLREFLWEGFCAPGGSNFFQERRGLRKMLAQGQGKSARAPDKHSAVPVIIALSDKLFSPLQIRFFREAL